MLCEINMKISIYLKKIAKKKGNRKVLQNNIYEWIKFFINEWDKYIYL